jgi:hypothetical protein
MLSADDLSALLTTDRKIAFQRFHITGSARIHSDGGFQIRVPQLGQDTGDWWLERGEICSRWATFRQGRKLCAVVGLADDGTYRGFNPQTGAYLGEFRFSG